MRLAGSYSLRYLAYQFLLSYALKSAAALAYWARSAVVKKPAACLWKSGVGKDIRASNGTNVDYKFDKAERKNEGSTVVRSSFVETSDWKLTVAILPQTQVIVSKFSLFDINLSTNTSVTDQNLFWMKLPLLSTILIQLASSCYAALTTLKLCSPLKTYGCTQRCKSNENMMLQLIDRYRYKTFLQFHMIPSLVKAWRIYFMCIKWRIYVLKKMGSYDIRGKCLCCERRVTFASIETASKHSLVSLDTIRSNIQECFPLRIISIKLYHY